MGLHGTRFYCFYVIILALSTRVALGSNYGKGFLNHTGCLYAYLEGGEFQMTTSDGDEIEEKLNLDSLIFELNRLKCSSQNQPGRLVFSFKFDEKNKIKSITIAMRIISADIKNYWEVSQANLTVTRADLDKKRTFSLEFPDIYASPDHSYSCNELTFQTWKRKKTDNETRSYAHAKITLDRFQLQPFSELPNVVFGPSYDCYTWMTIPGFMGFILVLFMTVVTVIGTIFLKKIETNDFKNNKEGLLFTQSQMEASKRVQ